MKTSRLLPATFALTLLLFGAAVPRISAINISEGGDFANSAGAATTYPLDFGVNTFSGTVSPFTDVEDHFKVSVPAGMLISGASKTWPGSAAGAVTFNGEVLISPPDFGSFITGFPLAAGVYSGSATYGIGFSSAAWSVTINVVAEYAVTVTTNSIAVTDLAGNGDTLDVTEPVAGQIRFAAGTRTFSVNGGAIITGNSGNLSLTNIGSVTVNVGAGNNTINVAGFAGTSFPSLTINGGTGNDTVNFNGDISFAGTKNLDVNLQDDGGSPGVDTVNVAANAHLVASGSGDITLLCSKNIALASGALVQVAQGDLDMEANQQEPATPGNFSGVYLEAATLASTFSGEVTVKGRGGDDASGSQYGVLVNNGAKIIGSTSGTFINVTGTGGASTGILNRGVTVYGAGSAISAPSGGQVIVNGTAGANGGFYGIGVSVLFGGVISGGGGGCFVTGTGRGAPGSGFNQGIELGGAGSLISSRGGVSLTATTGPGASVGVFVDNSAAVTTTAGTGPIGIKADSFSIDATSTIAPTNTASFVFFTPISATNIDLGGAGGPGTLGLSDAQLDRVTTKTLIIIGGEITISASITRSNPTDLVLNSGAGIRGTAIGTDLSLGTGTLFLNGLLACTIAGPLPDSDYEQLNVVGGVSFNGVPLALNSSYDGSIGQTFTLLNNDGSDAIIFTFFDMPEGTIFAWPGSPALNARISYVGGDGNDVVITLVSAFIVTSAADSGVGSLRTAVGVAATDPGADIITFDPSLSGQTIGLTSEILIDDGAAVIINASSLTNGLTISGSNTTRIFNIASGSTVSLTNLTITGGKAPDGVVSGENGKPGGAILNSGTLTLSHCAVTGSSSGNGVTQAASIGKGGDGGGIWNDGILVMEFCVVSSNRVGISPSGNFPQLGGDGGGIYNSGSLTLHHCSIVQNAAGQGGGGTSGTAGRGGHGGGVFNSGSLLLEYCSLSGNAAGAGGGGSFNGGSGGNGGGIHNAGGTATLLACTLSANRTIDGSSGSSGHGGSGGHAGGLFSIGGSLRLQLCTLSGNQSGNGGGGGFFGQGGNGGSGGGLFITGGTNLVLHSCTISGNQAGIGSATGQNGPGVAGNGGGISLTGTNLALEYSIVAANSVSAGGSGADIFNSGGTVTRLGACIIQSSTNTNGGTDTGPAAINADPRLLPLGDYGGPTLTTPPYADSPAVDAAFGSTDTTDQRGVFRPFNGDLTGPAVRDIGAVEFNNFVEVTTTADELDLPAGAALSLREALRDATEGALIYFSQIVFFPSSNTITLASGELHPAHGVVINADSVGGVTINGNNLSRILSISENPVDITAATGTTATQSSDYNAFLYLGAEGIDGDDFNFTSTSGVELESTWTADFHRDVFMTRVEIVNRESCCQERLRDITIVLLDANNAVLYTSPVLNPSNVLNGPVSLSVTLSNAVAVRKVQVKRNPGSAVGDDRVLSIAELKVFNTPSISLQGLTLTGGNGTGAAQSGDGGAILNSDVLTLTRCTLFGNNASLGGAIWNGGTAMLTQCTLSTNHSAGFGGAVENLGISTLTHCTLSGNSSAQSGGAIDNYQATLTLNNCIVAGNTATNAGADIIDDTTTINFVGSNIVQSLSSFGSFTNNGTAPINANPLLAPLGNYGGPTMTMALMPGSPARNAASGSTITTDQRGFPTAGVPDIGAYEAGSFGNYDSFAWEWFPTSASFADRDRNTDYDGDGRVNGLEYGAISDPLLSNSVPVFTFNLNAAGTVATNSFYFRFVGKDLNYQLFRTTNLNSGWSLIYELDLSIPQLTRYDTNLTLNNDIFTQRIADPSIAGQPQTFYRLQIILAP